MTKKLRVLMVEDSGDCAETMLGHLRAAGFEPDACCVSSVEALREALAESQWDAVISCYRMSGMSALAALRVVQDTVRDLPFIVCSGTEDEDAATECLRAGAADFISGSHLARLGLVVAREVRVAAGRRDRRLMESALRKREASARRIVAASNEGIIVVDANRLVRYLNPAAEAMLGGDAEGLLGRELPLGLDGDSGAGEVDMAPVAGVSIVVEARWSPIDWGGEDATLVILHDVTIRRRTEAQLRDSFINLADTLSRAMASRDPYTTNHQQRVAGLVVQVGARMGLKDAQLWELRLGGLLHDVGKVAVPESLLTKPGRLTPEELEIVRTHPQQGYVILKDAGLPPAVALMALHHHENLDGTGYPQGLAGNALSVEDRILTASNVLESLTSFRPYRRAFTVERALSTLKDGMGRQFDGDVVDCLNGLVRDGAYEPGLP